MAQDNAVEVGKNHKRAIGATLTLLDEMLCEFKEYAQGREHHGVLYHERNSLSDKQRRGMAAEVAAMRGTMRELKEALRLTASRDGPRSRFGGGPRPSGKCSWRRRAGTCAVMANSRQASRNASTRASRR